MLEAHAEVESVSLMLELQHRRLDDLFDRVEIATEIGSWSEARREFGLFRTALEEHLRIEEEFMFPSFEAFTRALGGPTAAMRDEHREICRFLDAIEGLLGDEQPIGELVAAFEGLLERHNAKEEQGLYPMFERHAPAEAYSALDRELRSVAPGTK
jgi:iron-sulfur cluster repair protein YtfE (RIC family)